MWLLFGREKKGVPFLCAAQQPIYRFQGQSPDFPCYMFSIAMEVAVPPLQAVLSNRLPVTCYAQQPMSRLYATHNPGAERSGLVFAE